MNSVETELLTAFELHSPDRIKAVLEKGFDVGATINGQRPINALIEMYLRSDRFPSCLQLLLEWAATLDDPNLSPVLLDDPEALSEAIHSDPSLLQHRTTMVCAFTPLIGASLLHVAAEYGHLKVARRLLELGADVDARADQDSVGFGGQTPLFHTVNSNENRSEPVMRLLLEAGARANILLGGITWGKDMEWETECFDVTAVSYAQLGLLRQFQRSEEDTYCNVRTLLKALGRAVPQLRNIPNRYLYKYLPRRTGSTRSARSSGDSFVRREDFPMRMVPVIKTSDLCRSIRFYTEVLDFTWKWPEYAEAEIANGVADLTMEGADLQLSRHAGDGVFGSLKCIFVDDVEERYAKFLSRGLDTTLRPESPVHTSPTNQTWDLREFSVTDPDGNGLCFCGPITSA